MARQKKAQRATVGRVIHEFKEGELESGSGRKVRNPRQAVAIALSEAGASNRQSPAENRSRLRTTKAKERQGRTAQAGKEGKAPARRTLRHAAGDDMPSRAELYRQAQERGVKGRSKMSRQELARALHH